ncbi:chemotaxis protein MotA [Bradyrhizobium sp. GM7.3]
MGSFVGIVITVAALLGGFAAMGGHLGVLMQPWEFVIIMGTAAGTFIMANPWKTVADTGLACVQAVTGAVPGQRYYLDLLGALHALMRELRGKGRNEVEAHIDDPASSEIFKAYPSVLGDPSLLQFICDYVRLIIMGNARTHEIEALMDEEIHTIVKSKLAPYHALVVVSEALPALGIVAAVLGVIKAMGALDQSPKLLGGFIGAALVGNLCRYFPVLRDHFALRDEGEDDAREALPALHHRQADAAGVHERRHAADRRRARPQDDREPRAALDRRRRERDDRGPQGCRDRG